MPRLMMTSLILLALAAAGCSLGADSDEAEEALVTETATQSAVTPEVTDRATQTTATTAGANTAAAPPCTPRTEWPAYTVLRGDTLFGIASRAGSSVEAISRGNCLSDSSQLSAGQTLRVPIAIVHAPPRFEGRGAGQPVTFYAALDPAAVAPPGTLSVACESGVVPVETDSAITLNPADDIRAALAGLLSTPTGSLSGTGLSNPLADMGLSLTSVTISGRQATVDIAGELQLIGSCGDGLYVHLFLLAIFQSNPIDSALIRIGGRNLQEIVWAGGPEPAADAIYTRDNMVFVE